MSVLSWFYGIDEETERGRKLDAQLRELNQRKVEEGKWSQEQADQANANLAMEDPGTYAAQVDEAFQEGLAEGYQNVTGAVKSTLAAPFRFAWDSIPWQLWAVGLGLVLYYTGAWRILRGAFK